MCIFIAKLPSGWTTPIRMCSMERISILKLLSFRYLSSEEMPHFPVVVIVWFIPFWQATFLTLNPESWILQAPFLDWTSCSSGWLEHVSRVRSTRRVPITVLQLGAATLLSKCPNLLNVPEQWFFQGLGPNDLLNQLNWNHTPTLVDITTHIHYYTHMCMFLHHTNYYTQSQKYTYMLHYPHTLHSHIDHTVHI